MFILCAIMIVLNEMEYSTKDNDKCCLSRGSLSTKYINMYFGKINKSNSNKPIFLLIFTENKQFVAFHYISTKFVFFLSNQKSRGLCNNLSPSRWKVYVSPKRDVFTSLHSRLSVFAQMTLPKSDLPFIQYSHTCQIVLTLSGSLRCDFTFDQAS